MSKAAEEGVSAMSKGLSAAKTAMNKNSIVGKVLQVVLGLVIVLLIYYLAITIMNSDNLASKDPYDTTIKRQVPIIDGYADSSQVAGNTYNTVIPFAANSLTLTPSPNIKGGAQFTYMLWLNVGATDNSMAGKTIFLRGDAQKYNYTVTDKMTQVTNTVNDFVAFCPMLQFGVNSMDFRVKFNTANNMNEELYVANITNDNDLYRKNILSLFSNKWILISIVFEDNIPINDFENGLSVKFYINDQIYALATYPTMLKQNNGDLYLFPEGALNKVMISNMQYFNYALGVKEIKNFYMAGPSSKSTSSVTKSFISPTMLNDMNRLDIYNA